MNNIEFIINVSGAIIVGSCIVFVTAIDVGLIK